LAFGSSCDSLQFNCNCLVLLKCFLLLFWNGPVLKARCRLPVQHVLQLRNASTPQYLADLLQIYMPSHTLRSTADTLKLKIPVFKKKYWGQRSFSYQEIFLHNLPFSVRHTKTLLIYVTVENPLLLPNLIEPSLFFILIYIIIMMLFVFDLRSWDVSMAHVLLRCMSGSHWLFWYVFLHFAVGIGSSGVCMFHVLNLCSFLFWIVKCFEPV